METREEDAPEEKEGAAPQPATASPKRRIPIRWIAFASVGAAGIVAVALVVLPMVAGARRVAAMRECENRLGRIYSAMLTADASGIQPGIWPAAGGHLRDGTPVGAGPFYWAVLARTGQIYDAGTLTCPLTGRAAPAIDYAGPAIGVDPDTDIRPTEMIGRDIIGNHGEGDEAAINVLLRDGTVRAMATAQVRDNEPLGWSRVSDE